MLAIIVLTPVVIFVTFLDMAVVLGGKPTRRQVEIMEGNAPPLRFQ